MGCLRVIGNIIWMFTFGLVTAIGWFLLGLILCITIVGIPFGTQCFKFARLTLAPFGKDVKLDFGEHPIINVIWLILFGWEMALVYCLGGIISCITIVGIPFGMQTFKLARLSLTPFGAIVT